MRFDAKQANESYFIRFKANKYLLHIRLYSLTAHPTYNYGM